MSATDWDSVSDLSSPLSSVASLSPAPPDFYPSPPSSQAYRRSSPSPEEFDSSTISVDVDGHLPPPKKRKVSEPKVRTTQYLDLRSDGPGPEAQSSQLELLLKVLRKRRKIVVVAGAGISVSAGIPDFRSSTGLFATLREQHKLKASGKHLFDASVYRTDTSTSSFHDMVRNLSQLSRSSEPTAFHHLLARLAQEGRLLRLYSQNVDGIDTSLPPLRTEVPLRSKGPWPKTIQLHGGLEKMVCQKCRHCSDFEPALFEGPLPPVCRECEVLDAVRTNVAGKRSHGIGRLRPRIVLYNEHNPDEEAIGAVTTSDLRSRPDAVIVVGTSLKVPGVKRIVREMCGVTRSRRDGIAIWINNGPEPVGREFENCWDLIVRGNSDEVARHAALRRWYDEEPSFQEVSDEALAQIKSEQGDVSVVVDSPRKKLQSAPVEGIPTPRESPVVLPFSFGTIVDGKKKSKPKSERKASNKTLDRKVPATKKVGRPKKNLDNAKTSIQTQGKNSVQKINDTFKITKSQSIQFIDYKAPGKDFGIPSSHTAPSVSEIQPSPEEPPNSATATIKSESSLFSSLPGINRVPEPVSDESQQLSYPGRLPPSLAMIVN